MIAGKTPAEWEVIRPHYEDGPETIVALCKLFRTSKSAIRKASIVFRWRLRRPRRIDRTDIIERLFRLLDLQVLEQENNAATARQDHAAVLGKLVGTLDKLIAIRDAETARRHPVIAVRDVSDIKVKLIERIEQLKRH